jgi:hypothetical protein
MFACDEGEDLPPENETDWFEVVSSASWRVDQVTATQNSQSENVQNVQVTFSSGGQYTLLIPGISDFGSDGTWTVNDQGTQITFNDGNQELVVQSTIEEDGSSMILTFQWSNFKAQAVSYRIELVS